MIIYQSLHRTLEYLSDTYSLQSSSCPQLRLVMEGHASYRMDFTTLVTSEIRLNISFDKISEVIDYQCLYSIFFKMFVNEWRKTGKKAICQRLTINPVDDSLLNSSDFSCADS